VGASGFGSAQLDRAERFRQRPILAYCTAIAAFALALALRFALNGVLPTGFPYLTFFPAVLLTAFFCGTGPGIVTAALSVVAAWYWFIPPFDSFALDTQSTIAVLFFIVILTADILIIHLMHSALTRLREEQGRTAHLLERQNTLFEELQHRTANNMSFIGALLSMHKRRAAHLPEVRSVFEDASARLESMSRIHRRLYDPTNSDLPLDTYFGALLQDTFEGAGRNDITVDVRSSIGRIDVNRLITLSLIVTELATNAVKHAFAGRKGHFKLLLEDEGDTFRVTVRDDGPGFPDGFDPASGDRLGFRVLSSFARTLDGTLDFRTDNGALTTITFAAANPREAGPA
jgi:two-component sensor histidine kinase